ncbi:MAG: TldD/PmbA family protein [Chloroherpetonaceae bacterium]|nr:TldD/PmbA family protein [Chloroherpetonaceae bacterium]
MPILTKEEAQAILSKALGYSKAPECEVNLGGSVGGNIRYARNTVSTSGENSNMTLVVQSKFGKKTGTATVNEFTDAAIERTVRRAEELAQLAPENPEAMPLLGQQKYLESVTAFASTEGITPEYRTKVAEDSIIPCTGKDLQAAGFLDHDTSFGAVANSAGLSLYQKSTSVEFTLTVRTTDGTGSGYVTRDYNDVSQFNSAAASQVAIEKALRSREAKAIEPGKYTVILEPAALLANTDASLIGAMINAMDARSADEGRSFFSKKGGGNKIGEKFIDERISVFSDPTNSDIPSTPWVGDGRPREKTTWVENGVLQNLFYSRYWAEKKEKKSIAPPGGIIIPGTNASLEDLIKDTKKGILITRLWYIRPVDPQTLLYTGLTRDGTFFIENGKIAFPIKNMRFNESPIIMLNNLEALGKPVRMAGNMIPPMKIRDFTFESLSDAV